MLFVVFYCIVVLVGDDLLEGVNMDNKINVVVIDDNENLANEVEKYFHNHGLIKVVSILTDGEKALEYLLHNSDCYDLIILDILLPKIDGIFILNELKRHNIKKKIIINTEFKDSYLLREANNLGVNYYMMKPVNFASLEKRIMNMFFDESNCVNLTSLQTKISDMLHTLGVPTHLRGYLFIREGVKILYNNDNISYITKDVYPMIADKYNSTPTRVERAIRHAIEISWSRGDINVLTEFFGNSVDLDRDRPTNAEYLVTIADRLKISGELICS